MKKKLIYTIGIATIALSSCSDDRNDTPGFLNGNEKTPIVVVTNLQANNIVTRAVNAEFEVNDQLNAYIKHVTVSDANANPLVYSADVTGTGVGPRLANFKISGLTDDHKNEADNWTNHSVTSTLTVTDATGLYWDDFSNSASASTDLRTDKHALQVYYGYGYNGGTASTSLTETTGTLGWTVATDQSNGFKTSDLLYAGTQVPVAYVHGTNNTINGRDKVLTVPYSHAMSKVTVEVICADGFNPEVDNFANASVKLKSMNTAATVTAPSQNLSSYSASEDITTFGTANITNPNKRKSFSALIAPTVMKADMVLAEIIGVDGNNYEIKLTDAVIDAKDSDGTTTLTNAWSTQLATVGATEVTPATQADYNATNGGLTKPGVHYMITVTIKKQEIKVSATIQNWVAVSATGIGDIMFDSDVKDVPDGIADDLKANGFDLYKSENSIFGTKATTVSWDGSSWVYTPKIYWESSSDAEYFRALSGAYADDATTVSVNESLAMVQDRDVLWATTPAHSGTDVNGNNYNYAKSDKINPRTGNVPLEFEHAMTNISVELKTPAGLTEVDLTNARIDIINTYNKGIINLYSGDISDFELDLTAPAVYTLSETVNSDHKMLNKVVIPQSLVNDKDGATRDDSPTFYQSGELTRIYDDGTSLPAGGGTGKYYLTSSLDIVNYVAGDLTAIYADGTSNDDGSGSSENYVTATLDYIDAVLYTQQEIDAAKTIVDAVTSDVITTAAAHAGDVKTPASLDYAPAVLYTQAEIDDAKSIVAAATAEIRTTAAATAGTVKTAQVGTAPVYYTQQEIDDAKAIVDAVTDDVRAIANKTTSDVKIPASSDYVPDVYYTQAEIDAAKAIVDAVTPAVEAAARANAGDEKTPVVTHPATQDDVDNGKATAVGDPVEDAPAVYYTQQEIDDAKAKVAAATAEVRATAAATAGTVKTAQVGTAPVYYTQQEINDAKAKVDALTSEIEEIASKTTEDIKTPASNDYEPAVLYTQDEIDAAKEIVDAVTAEVIAAAEASEGQVKTPQVGTPEVLYAQDEIDDAVAKIAAKTPEVIETSIKTAGDVKVPAYYKTNGDSVMAEAGDFKCYKTNGSSEQHSPGELKTVGDKIMMYITLNNGTRYKLELSKCKDSNGDLITEWKRGKHYTYEITLGKEEIKFRALIKDWDVTTGSGNATIDWD